MSDEPLTSALREAAGHRRVDSQGIGQESFCYIHAGSGMSDPLTEPRAPGQLPFWLRDDTDEIQERQLRLMIEKEQAYAEISMGNYRAVEPGSDSAFSRVLDRVRPPDQ
jgi:hypothetical protein